MSSIGDKSPVSTNGDMLVMSVFADTRGYAARLPPPSDR
jgi:hypothetical protein